MNILDNFFGKRKRLKELTANLYDDNHDVRKAAAKELDELGWQPDRDETGAAYWVAKKEWGKCVQIGAPAVRLLLDSLESKDTWSRDQEEIIRTLGDIGSPQAVETLVAALNDDSKYRRESVTEAIGKIGGVRAVEALVSILEDESPSVRIKAIKALDHIGWQPDQKKVGVQYWTVKYLYWHGKDEQVRQGAAESLRRTSWKPDASEAGAAYWIVRRQWDKCVEIGVPAVMPLFVTLQDSDENVREAAAEALEHIGKPAVDLLTSALDQHFSWAYTDASSLVLRITAAKVLGKIGDPRAIEVLIRMFHQSERTSEHKRAAADALAMIGEPAVEPLLAALAVKNQCDWQGVAWALGQIGDKRAVEPLINLLSSHYSHHRKAAQEALKSITGQDFGEDVNRWLEWEEGFAPGEGPHTDEVNAVVVTPDGRLAVSGSRDKTIKIWDIKSGKLVTTYETPKEVNSVTVTTDGKKILFGTVGEYVQQGLQIAEIDSRVYLWNLESGEEIASFRHDGGVYAVAMTPNERYIVSGSGTGNVKVWNMESREEEVTFGYDKLGVPGVYSLAITPDGQQIISVSGHGNMTLWDLKSGKEVVTFSGHNQIIKTLAITSDGRLVVSGSYDKTLKVWDVISGKELATLKGHNGKVNAIAVTHDGHLATSGSSDNTLKIWDLACNCELHTLKGHTGKVCDVAITPDGKYILSASADKTLKMWSLDTGNEVRTFTGK